MEFVVQDLHSQLASLTRSIDLYQARKVLKEAIRLYSDSDLQNLAEILLEEKDADKEGSYALFGIIASIRANREHSKQQAALSAQIEAVSDDCCSKKKAFEEFVYSNYRSFLRYPDLSPETAEKKAMKWLQLFSGDLTSLKVDPNGLWVEYGDHVTRMQAISGNRQERKHFFSIPDLGSDENFVVLNIPKLSAEDPTLLERTLADVTEEDRQVIGQELYGFDYTNLEKRSSCGHRAILLPDALNRIKGGHRGFNEKEDGSFQVDTSVLHMPVKISEAAAKLFNDEGRRLPDGSMFRADEAYIPEGLAKGSDFMALVKQTMVMEYQLNKKRFLENFLLVTLRVGELSKSQSLGNTGWHVDGHQGAERLQMDGTKMPIDRVYCMSNVLPTQVTDLRLDLNPVRQKARSKLMTLDQFNLQDIIQKTVEKAEADAQEHGETIITTAGENCLFYANPYVLHQSPVNNSDKIVRRSFVRLLYTVDERDRIGDTVSPVIGPCYPFKIKTITDILQLPSDIQVSYQTDVTKYPVL